MKAIIDFILSLFAKPSSEAPFPKVAIIPEEAPEIVPEELPKKQTHTVAFKNQSERLVKEFNSLGNKNKDLKELILELSDFVSESFGKNIVITMIYRTQAEQDHIYKKSTRYQKRKFKSPHQFYHAVDIRSSSLKSGEVRLIEEFLNGKWNSKNYYKWTAKHHTVGFGYHFHIQFIKK